MFEEAQLYAPVTQADDGSVTVHLGAGHPGLDDPAYRARRNDIAAAALAWEGQDPPAGPVPRIAYTPEEDAIWATVSRELHDKHERLACAEVLAAKAALGLPEDRVPQLDEVTAGLEPLTGWRYVPAAGLVPLRQFYSALGDRTFHSTQYVRHGSQPLYTPEPDVVHEVIGHGTLLASPRIAEVKRQAGLAAQRVTSDAALQVLADVFWFTIEFGVVREDGAVKAYGAGLLSSYGEIEELPACTLRPVDFRAMATQEYDITHYQPVLFCCDGMEELYERVGAFFAAADDDLPARLGLQDAARAAA